jgi:hypothetical protein
METTQTHCYVAGTVTLPWKCNMVHRSCYQGKPDMSQYVVFIIQNKLCKSIFFPNLMVWDFIFVNIFVHCLQKSISIADHF